MPPTRSRHRRSSAQPHTQNHSQSHGRRSRAHVRSQSPVPRRQSRSKGRRRNPEEGSLNTLTGRELFRALNKASERGTQGKEM